MGEEAPLEGGHNPAHPRRNDLTVALDAGDEAEAVLVVNVF